MNSRRDLVHKACLALAGCFVSGIACAAEYPTQTITITLPVGPGTGLDGLARAYGDGLQKALGIPVVIKNMPGSANLSGAFVAKSPADGHTLLVATAGNFGIAQTLHKHLAYDPAKDFIPIAYYAKSPFILVTSPQLPVQTVADLVAFSRQTDAPVTFSSIGTASPQRLRMESFLQTAGLTMIHVPYRDTTGTVTDTMSGIVQTGFMEAGATIPLIKEKKLKALAVTSAGRHPLLPDVPPLWEALGRERSDDVGWHILVAPASTPREVVDLLRREVGRIVATSEFKTLAAGFGLVPIDTPSVEEMQTFLRSEATKWGALVTRVGLAGSQ